MTRPHVAPGAVFALCVVLYLAAAAALTWVATAQPWLGIRLGVVGQSVVVTDIAQGSALKKLTQVPMYPGPPSAFYMLENWIIGPFTGPTI